VPRARAKPRVEARAHVDSIVAVGAALHGRTACTGPTRRGLSGYVRDDGRDGTGDGRLGPGPYDVAMYAASTAFHRANRSFFVGIRRLRARAARVSGRTRADLTRTRRTYHYHCGRYQRRVGGAAQAQRLTEVEGCCSAHTALPLLALAHTTYIAAWGCGGGPHGRRWAASARWRRRSRACMRGRGWGSRHG